MTTFPSGLPDQLRVELLQVHQQQERPGDRRLPCLYGASPGMFVPEKPLLGLPVITSEAYLSHL